MRLIDADKVIERINGTGYAEQIKSNLRFIADMQPTIDAVEVVRCENCKHRVGCKRYITTWEGSGELNYCSFGERKEDDER